MIIIAGKNNIAVNALSYLALSFKAHKLAVVCNDSDTGVDFWQMSLRKKAAELGIIELSLYEAERVAEIFISLEFDKIIKINNFNTHKLFNIHFSLLPKYRGMYTSTLPILNNEKKTGVTLHKIDDGIDTGDIISALQIEISDTDCSLDLYIKYTSSALELFIHSIANIIGDKYECIEQEKINTSYYSKDSINFNKKEVCFEQSSVSIIRFVRAYSFRPYQMPVIKNNKIVNVEILSTKSNLSPGSTIKINDSFIDLSTIDFDIRAYFDKFNLIVKLCEDNKISKIKKILKNLVNIDDRTDSLQTLLMISVMKGFYDLSKFLILSGANVNAIDSFGESVLHYANKIDSEEDKHKIISLLINNGGVS